MSSNLPRTIPVDKSSLTGIKTVADLVVWLAGFAKAMDEIYGLLRDHIENGGMGTPNWDIKEAKAADVVSGDANTVGDLMVKHKTTGVERLFESTP